MGESKDYMTLPEQNGSVNIAKDVIAAVEKAASLGLAAVSITDHDSVSGVPEAMRAGAELGVEVVPGIEVSSDYRDNNVHILGYFIDLVDKKNAQKGLKGVRISVSEENQLTLDLYLTVNYGVSIPETAENAQKAVATAVEDMTGCKVSAVNAHVGGVSIA